MKSDGSRLKVLLVGAGNVAGSLAEPLSRRFELVGWANRTPEKLYAQLPAPGCRVLALGEAAGVEADVVIVSVADSALAEVVAAMGRLAGNPLCLLTSGTLGMEALRPLSERVGVLYPLQTFTRGFEVDVAAVPFFTEASAAADLALADAIGGGLGARVCHADADKRRTLHIAGVMANNFVNILLERTQNILEDDGFPLEVVRPLVEMTVRKAFAIGPHAAQTGPARRGDLEVMTRQLARVPDDLKTAFAELNKLIIKAHEQD